MKGKGWRELRKLVVATKVLSVDNGQLRKLVGWERLQGS